MRFLILIACLFLSLPAHAVMSPDEKLNDPVKEARAQALTRTLRCVVCQNQSVEDSNADIARSLRITVRKQILAGKTDREIEDYLRARYGDYILLKPPVSPRTYALWLAPLVVLIAGAWMAARGFVRRRR